MVQKIGGDMLALDADIRRQIESETRKLTDRFPGEQFDTQVTIKEEFDQLNGHRVRCELSARLSSGHQVVVRDARKSAADAIEEVFNSARRSVRRLRLQGIADLASATQGVAHAASGVAP